MYDFLSFHALCFSKLLPPIRGFPRMARRGSLSEYTRSHPSDSAASN